MAWTQEKLVRLLLDAALAHRSRGDKARARTLLDEALDVSLKENQQSWIAAVRASQGALARSDGDLDQAKSLLTEAMRLRRQMEDRLGLARALGDLAGVHLDAGRVGEASLCIEEALESSAGSDAGRTRAEVLDRAGDTYLHSGDTDRAEEYYDEAARIYIGIGDERAAQAVRSKVAGGPVPSRERNLDEALAAVERDLLLAALEQEGWNQSRAARRLRVTETRVRNLMRRHGVNPRNRRGRPRKTRGGGPSSDR